MSRRTEAPRYLPFTTFFRGKFLVTLSYDSFALNRINRLFRVLLYYTIFVINCEYSKILQFKKSKKQELENTQVLAFIID